MRVLRFIVGFCLILPIMLLQSCGSGSSDTSGTLTIGTPSITSTGTLATGGVHSASFPVTYTPPAGKTFANGLVQNVVIQNASGTVVASWSTTLTDSRTFTYSFTVDQLPTVQVFSIVASVNSMTAGAPLIFPAGT